MYAEPFAQPENTHIGVHCSQKQMNYLALVGPNPGLNL